MLLFALTVQPPFLPQKQWTRFNLKVFSKVCPTPVSVFIPAVITWILRVPKGLKAWSPGLVLPGGSRTLKKWGPVRLLDHWGHASFLSLSWLWAKELCSAKHPLLCWTALSLAQRQWGLSKHELTCPILSQNKPFIYVR